MEIRICGGTTTCSVLLGCEPVEATAKPLNTPLHPAGDAVTVLFTEPVPVFWEKLGVASQLLFGLLVFVNEKTGVKVKVAGLVLTVTCVAVSPVERFTVEGEIGSTDDGVAAASVVVIGCGVQDGPPVEAMDIPD
jgi:hypothetical protein